ncbi:hypothetical protein VE02_01997 [Pseudogymnoascus sp. 03VT05]|nr:hypothetical protein VE02_01997 [Pseudogymnoascus sp. 03VT05]
MEDGKPVEGSLYVYAPNKIAPVFFAVSFAASAVGHIWQCHRYKCFQLIGLHPLCAALFFAGYVLREYGAFDYVYTGNFVTLITFILSQVFIYICPPLLELANYPYRLAHSCNIFGGVLPRSVVLYKSLADPNPKRNGTNRSPSELRHDTRLRVRI